MADENKGNGFSVDEEKAIRELIQERDRAKWFWASVRIWALGATAVIGAITLTYDAIARFIKSIGGA